MRINTKYGFIDVPKMTMWRGTQYTFIKAKGTKYEADIEMTGMKNKYKSKVGMYMMKTPIVEGKNKGKGIYALYITWRK